MIFKGFREERRLLVEDFNSLLRNTMLGIRRRIGRANDCVCSECGRLYADPDMASICADWDSILGTDRHYWTNQDVPKSGPPR